MNKTPVVSLAGTWTYSTTKSNFGIVPFYSQIKLGTNQTHGVVLGGWGYAGWDNKVFNPINIAILDQQANGTLKVNTAKYISDPLTNGEGSVIVSDFNADGIDDIFLAAHNESPDVDKSSTAYISNGVDTYTKLSLNDAVRAHSARISDFNGIKTVITSGYGSSDPFYQFDPSSKIFTISRWGNTHSGSLYGSSAITADLNNDGLSELVIVDCKTGPGWDYDANKAAVPLLYTLNGNSLSNNPQQIATPYYNDKSAYDKYQSQYPGKTHQANVWAEDFNHDSQLDLIIGSEIFSQTGGTGPATLQFLQNQGALKFSDVTDHVQSTLPKNTWFDDYAMQIVDIDRSGINSFLIAMYTYDQTGFPGNYLLLNDGTGQLYSAIDQKQFALWVKQLAAFSSSNLSASAPQLIAYQTSNDTINYLASMGAHDGVVTLLNLPAEYNPTTDFTQFITIDDRNQSSLIRTFAGDDVIHDTNRANVTTHIDGGLGIDTCVYSSTRDTYDIKPTATGFSVQSKVNPNQIDLISNIETLQFSDLSTSLKPIEGTGKNDQLTGTDAPEELFGYAGDDKLTGGAGNDTLDGGIGKDIMTGGYGDDVYFVDGTGDKVVEKSNEGTDTVKTTLANYAMSSNVENLTYTGSNAFKNTGNVLANVITGGAGNDSLNGGLGNDMLIGGDGMDRFVFNTTLSTTNVDTIVDFQVGIDKIQLSPKIFTKLKSAKNYLALGTASDSATHYLVYDSITGKLSYDADGNANKVQPVDIALIGTGLILTTTNIAIA